MDVITVGSPVPIYGGVNEAFLTSVVSESSSSSIVTIASSHQPNRGAGFEPPATERLLPIGNNSSWGSRQTENPNQKMLDSQGRILDRVWQVFGSMEKPDVDGLD